MEGVRAVLEQAKSNVVRIAIGGDSFCNHHPFQPGLAGESVVTAFRRNFRAGDFGTELIGDTFPFATDRTTKTISTAGGIRASVSPSVTSSVIQFFQPAPDVWGDSDRRAYVDILRITPSTTTRGIQRIATTGIDPNVDFLSQTMSAYAESAWWNGATIQFDVIWRDRTIGNLGTVLMQGGYVNEAIAPLVFDAFELRPCETTSTIATSTVSVDLGSPWARTILSPSDHVFDAHQFPAVSVDVQVPSHIAHPSFDLAEVQMVRADRTAGIQFVGAWSSNGTNPGYWLPPHIPSRPFRDEDIAAILAIKKWPQLWIWMFNDPEPAASNASRVEAMWDRINAQYRASGHTAPLHVWISGYGGPANPEPTSTFAAQDFVMYQRCRTRRDTAFISGFNLAKRVPDIATTNLHFDNRMTADRFWSLVHDEMVNGISVVTPVCASDCAPTYPDGSAGNGAVNIDDLIAVINAFGSTASCDVAPVNADGSLGNGIVNVDDLVAVISSFGVCGH
ncbi:MAG: hypothetical protein AAF432_15770 [Planctomycetota bacterium]